MFVAELSESPCSTLQGSSQSHSCAQVLTLNPVKTQQTSLSVLGWILFLRVKMNLFSPLFVMICSQCGILQTAADLIFIFFNISNFSYQLSLIIFICSKVNPSVISLSLNSTKDHV